MLSNDVLTAKMWTLNIMTDLDSVLNSVELVDASMADGKCPLSDPFVQLVVSRELPRFDVEWQPL